MSAIKTADKQTETVRSAPAGHDSTLEKMKSAPVKPPRADVSALGAMPSLQELGITDQAIAARLEACEAQWQSSQRMDAEVVFIRGAVVAEGRRVCDSQETLDKWCRGRLKVTRRGAENYERVHHTFGDRSDRFIAACVSPTVMYKLLTAASDKVEAVLRHYETGRVMTVQEVAAFIGQAHDDVASEDSTAELAGVDGIRLLVREKLKSTIPDICQGLQVIMAACLQALDEHHRGVRVKKGELADQIEHEARIARSKLENLAFVMEPNSYGDPWRLFVKRPPHESRWGHLARLLEALGGRSEWSDPLGVWLIDEVIPALEWGLGSKLAEAVRAQDGQRLEVIATATSAAKNERKAARANVHKGSHASGVSPMTAEDENAAIATTPAVAVVSKASKQPRAGGARLSGEVIATMAKAADVGSPTP